MSKKSCTQTRRHFLKGAAYASALSLTGVAGLSKLAFADSKLMIQHQTVGGETVNLINHTASAVNFKGQIIAAGGHCSAVIAVDMVNGNSGVNKKDLFISDVLTDDQLMIRSDYPEFNGVFPVAEFDMLAA